MQYLYCIALGIRSVVLLGGLALWIFHCFPDCFPMLLLYSSQASRESRREEEVEEEEGRDKEVEDGEDETDLPSTLEATLDHLGLANLTGVFLKEQIDFDSLVNLLSLSLFLCLFRFMFLASCSADVL